MNIPGIIEKWDGVLYLAMNLVSSIMYFTKYRKHHRLLSRNRKFKNKHERQRCFVVLNGPSINNYELTHLKHEIVFATNYFFRAPICKEVEPDYYCWLDAKSFLKDSANELLGELRTVCPQAECFLNAKAYKKLGNQKRVNYVYAKHIPNIYGIKSNLSGVMSNFSTVAFLAINTAIYMGFKEIYVLGLDFEPGGFTHFTDLKSTPLKPINKSKKREVADIHWSYAKAHYESYVLADYARKKGIRIINLNPKSNIRAFEFGSFEELFADNTK